MKIHFNISRQSERERFVEGITRWLGYEREVTEDGFLVIGKVQIDKENNLIIADEMEDETVERLLQFLYDEGFESDLSYKFDDEPQADENSEDPTYAFEDFNFEDVDITKNAAVERKPYEKKKKAKETEEPTQPKAVIEPPQEIGYSLPPIKNESEFTKNEINRRKVCELSVTDAILLDLRNRYKEGTRVELIKMDDKQAPPLKTHGTVRHVDDIGTIHVSWDSGSSLGVVFGEDDCRPLVTMNDRIKEQILKIRATGITNMFDTKYVQWLANFCGYFELVCFIEDNVSDYVKFICEGRVGDYA